ncbi:MAG: hypothetical protein M1812_007114 [Candelaria pacifica]|nr:MAG: hypothetical protein M1812_007114 [Candelaria pacifica]
MSWTLLPVELWDMILDCTNQKDLPSLNRVCTLLKRLTDPYLHAQLADLDWTGGDWSQVKQRTPRIHFLLRSIINRPELANHIKHAKFKNYINAPAYERSVVQTVWEDASNSGFTGDEMTKIQDLVKSTNLSPRREWLEELDRGAGDVIIALLVSQLASLQSLDIQLDLEENDRPYVGTIFRQALTSASSTLGLSNFSSLKQITVSTEGHDLRERNVDFDTQIAPLFDLPSIEVIDLDWIGPNGSLWPGRQPITSTLTTLIIRGCHIKEDILSQLLAATPSLQNFSCHLVYDAEFNEWCHCDKLGSALQQIRTTLEGLKISVYWSASAAIDPSWGYSWGIRERIGSMKEFPKLTHLEIPLVIILGYNPYSAPWLWEVLPPNLYSFTCTDDVGLFEDFKWTHEDWLEEMTDYLAGEPQALKKITTRFRWVDWPDDAKAELNLAAEEAGVECRILDEGELRYG